MRSECWKRRREMAIASLPDRNAKAQPLIPFDF